jgi:hypothetical protein
MSYFLFFILNDGKFRFVQHAHLSEPSRRLRQPYQVRQLAQNDLAEVKSVDEGYLLLNRHTLSQ